MKISEYRIGFIGFGHMAKVIFGAIDRAKLIPRSQVLFTQRDRDKIRQNEKEFGITATSLKNLVDKSDLIFLGVRPDQAPQVLKELKEIDPTRFVISMISGLKIKYYEQFFKNPILRVMPNMAAEIGMGTTVFAYGPNVSNEQRSLSHILFSSMGQVIEIKETEMDIATAIGGSGPAFIFRLIEAMAKEGEKEGLREEVALKMAAYTFLGAASLVLTKGNPNALVEKIAVPNGTTEAGLDVMELTKMREHFRKVVLACANRSRELSDHYK